MKATSQILKIFLIVFLGIFTVSCTNNVEEEIIAVDPDPVDPVDPSAISFSTQVKPIIDASCIQCHNGGQFPDLRTYAGVSGSAARVKVRVANRTMPQGGSLSQSQIDLIVGWVDEGAQNN